MESKISIAKLNNFNYFTWKFKMQMILTKEKVWKTISQTAPTTPQTEIAAWTSLDETARAIIALSIEDNQLSLIIDKNTAKETWDALQEFHMKSTIVNKVTLMRQLFETKMNDTTSIEDHIELMSSYLQKLNGLGVTAFNEEDVKCAILLSSLPEKFRTLITSLETRDNLTWSIVTSKLLDESKHTSKNETDEKLLKVRAGNSQLFCKYCKRSNHSIENCKFLKNKKKNNKNRVDMIEENSSSDEILLSIKSSMQEQINSNEKFLTTNSSSNQDDWILDSGATSHCSNNKHLFINLQPLNDDVTVANGHKVKIQGIGNT